MSSTEYRVYGPPGCGKTTYIATQANEMVDRYGGDQISICSLTNTAVREAVGRDLPVDAENVTTLHARCKRSLNAPPPAEAFIEEFIDAYPQHATEGCLPPSLRHRRRKKSADDEPETTEEAMVSGSREPSLYEEVQILRQQMVPEREWRPDLRIWFGAWADFMAQTGRLDFTGWLEAALDAHSLPPQQVVFVDEAQDHTPLQLEVIRSWPTRHRILVGDDDQNLYEWSGAVPDRFFAYQVAPEREKVLSQSYRVPRAVHAVAQGWVKQLKMRREKVYHPKPLDGLVSRYVYSLRDAKAGILPGQIDPDSPMYLPEEETFMFLTSAGYMLDDLVGLLKEHRIPYHNPFRRSNPRWNPMGTIGPVIDAFLQDSWTGDEAYLWMRVLRSTDVFKQGRRKQALEWLQMKGRQEVLIDDLAEFLLPQTVGMIEREDLRIFDLRRQGMIGNWAYALDMYRHRTAEERVPRVIIGTVHSVKGGEADHVYLMPDLSPAAADDYYGPGRDRIVRLMYVGMTRAAQTLTLGDGSGRHAVFWN